MKMNFILIAVILVAINCGAQVPYNNAIPNGYTKKASVTEQVGLTNVSITYHRPSVKGREGKIWGGIVHKGFINQGFGLNKPAPWRAGANENTVIEFDTDVMVEGHPLSKGKYGFFIAYDSTESTIIFSKKTDGWGSFFYDEKDDALRAKVKPQSIDKIVENLKFEFSNQTPNSAIVSLSWDKLAIPFRIEVDYLKQQFEALVAESQNPRGFTAQGLTAAANWCLQNNYQLEKGLFWASQATGTNFPGDPTFFPALITKANILEKMGRSEEAAAVIKSALPFGTMIQLQQLGRQLIAAKKLKTAMEVFEFNLQKNPGQFIALTGMARGLSANGDFTKALEFANQAMAVAPNDAGRETIQTMIDKLKANKDIN